MSYSHFNDEHDKGYITQFRALLEGEVCVQTGREFMVFQDRRDIRWIFCLNFVPNADCFETLLDVGVAILFWPRRKVTKVTRLVLSDFKTKMAGWTIRDLPEQFRGWRADRWEEHRETGPLSLLWDNPQRLPPKDRPLLPHPDF